MRVGYYNTDTLRSELDIYEEKHGLISEDLLKLYNADTIPEDITGFDAFVWASTYREWQRLSSITSPQEI